VDFWASVLQGAFAFFQLLLSGVTMVWPRKQVAVLWMLAALTIGYGTVRIEIVKAKRARLGR